MLEVVWVCEGVDGREGLTALERKSRCSWVKGLEGLEVGVGFGEVVALSLEDEEELGEAAAVSVERLRGDVWRARVGIVRENRGVRKSYIGRLHRMSRAAGVVVIGAIVAL